MAAKKSFVRWMVNVVSFVFFTILAITGMINWLILPRGFAAKGGVLVSTRHFLREIHELAGLGFLIVIIVHMILNWKIIKNNLRSYGMLK